MSSSKSEIKLQQVFKELPAPRTSKRYDCPDCGGIGTLSVSNLGTIILFHCFRASCKLRGRRAVEISIDSIKKEFENPSKTTQLAFDLDNFLFIPEMINNSDIKIMIHKYNCWEAYREGRADIRYDPKEYRIVFMIYDLDVPVSAIGRRLSSKGGPKWKRYGKISMPFVCNKDIEEQTDTLIIVEDCCSACAASAYCDSAALLGTYLPAGYLREFLKYDKFIIALDKDASKLAFKMQKELQYYKPTKLLLLEEDLKDLNAKEIKDMFNV